LSGNSGSVPGGLERENRGVHDRFGQWLLFLFKLRLNFELLTIYVVLLSCYLAALRTEIHATD